MPIWLQHSTASLEGWLPGGGYSVSIQRQWRNSGVTRPLDDDEQDPNNTALWEETVTAGSAGSPAYSTLASATNVYSGDYTQSASLTLRLNPFRIPQLDRLTGVSADVTGGKIVIKPSGLSYSWEAVRFGWLADPDDLPGSMANDIYVYSESKWWGLRFVGNSTDPDVETSMGVGLAGVVLDDDELKIKLLESRNLGGTVNDDEYFAADGSFLARAYLAHRNDCGAFEFFLTPGQVDIAPDTDSIASSLRSYLPVEGITHFDWIPDYGGQYASGAFISPGLWIPFGERIVDKNWTWEGLSYRTGYAALDEGAVDYSVGLQYHEIGV